MTIARTLLLDNSKTCL